MPPAALNMYILGTNASTLSVMSLKNACCLAFISWWQISGGAWTKSSEWENSASVTDSNWASKLSDGG